jgi:hypothetical protein
MANDNEPTDDLHLRDCAGIVGVPPDVPVARFDYGDAAQQAEMEDTDEIVMDEPAALVDEPVQIRQPFNRAARKRRNQRPLPT